MTLKVPSRSMSTTALKPFGLMSLASAGKLPAAPETSTSIGPTSPAKAVERRVDGGGVAHVEGIAQGRSFACEFRDGGIDLLLPAAAHADPGAGGGEGLGDAEVDAAGAARDEDVAAGIVESGLHLSGAG